MAIKYQKKIEIESLVPRIIFFGSLVLFLYSTFTMLERARDYTENQNTIEQKEEEHRKNLREIESLESLIEYQKTDEYLELEVRKRNPIRRPNEQVIAEQNLLQQRNKVEVITVEEVRPPEDEDPNWRKWWDLFFG